MPSLSAISGAAISALPREAFNLAALTFEAIPRMEGIPFSAYLDFVNDENRMLAYVVEIPLRGLAGSGNSDTTLYAGTMDMTTESANTPSQTPIIGTMDRKFSVNRSVGMSGGLQLGIGAIELNNSDKNLLTGAYPYDAIPTGYAAEGEEVTVKVLQAPAISQGMVDYDDAFVVGRFIVERMVVDTEKLTLELKDKGFKLDVPAAPEKYQGTGGLEGGLELQGKCKPWALGWVENVTPAPVIPAELIYQVSFRGVQSIAAVYDSGGPLTATTNTGSLSALRAAVLSPGQYLTCNALGLIRLGGTPFGPVTADVEGDNVGGFVETTSEIVERLALIAAELSGSEIASNTIDSLAVEQPAPVGFFLSHEDNMTVAQAAGALMRGIGGYCGFNRLGLFETLRIEAPGIVASARYDEIAAVSIKREPLPEALDPPPHRFRVAYARNWTILSTIVAEETDADRVAWLQGPYKVVATSDTDGADILVDHPFAKDDPPVEAYFRDEDDAQDEADRLLELWSSQDRAQWSLTLKRAPFVHDVLHTIHVTKPRFDLTDGKMLRLTSIRDDLNTEGDSQEAAGIV